MIIIVSYLYSNLHNKHTFISALKLKTVFIHVQTHMLKQRLAPEWI